jgi:hypothetical protein
VWAKEEVDQRDVIKLAEEGNLLPGQGEPDHEGFKVANDWIDEYDDKDTRDELLFLMPK